MKGAEKVKLLQLKYFQTACQFNNITQAADFLYISQPAITKAIRDLEEEFGVTLLQRMSRGFKLTQEGEIFLNYADELIKQSDLVVEMMKDYGKNRKLIRLGVPPMIGTCFFPEIYKSFKMLYPEIKVTTREEGSKNLLSMLDKDALDILILPTNEVSSDEYNIINFLTTETVFCASEKHLLSNRTEVDLIDFVDEPLIMFNDGYYHSSLIYELFSKRKAEPNIIHTSTQLQTIIQFILNDIACGFLFKEVVKSVPKIKGISLNKKLKINVGLVYKKNSLMFTDMIKFIDHIKSAQF